MASKRIVIGQKVNPDKVAFARQLRNTMTPEEQLVWEELRANRLMGLQFRRQQVIDGYIVDFYCHRVGLVIEIDGESHDAQFSYDQERDQVLAGRNLLVLRFQNREVRQELGMVLHQITEACQQRLFR